MRRNDAPHVAGVVARTGRARVSTMYGGVALCVRCGLDVQGDHAAAYRLNRLFTAGADDRVQGTDVRDLV